MQPRSWWVANFLFVPVVGGLFFGLFFGVVFSLIRGLNILAFLPIALVTGLFWGICMGAFFAFLTRVVTVHFEVLDADALPARAQDVMRKLNYALHKETPHILYFKPNRGVKTRHLRVSVQSAGQDGWLKGPWIVVRRAARRLE